MTREELTEEMNKLSELGNPDKHAFDEFQIDELYELAARIYLSTIGYVPKFNMNELGIITILEETKGQVSH